MPSFTLENNCLINVDEKRPAHGDIRTLIEAARRGEADLAILASSAYERQPGGVHLKRFADFESRMSALGLGHISLLRPIGRHGLSFHGFSIMSDEATIERERLIFRTLFPTTPARWSDYAVSYGLDKKDLSSVAAWDWRNRLGAAQAFWAHENGGRHVFVTTNEGFARLPKKREFANAVIMTPAQAVQVLTGDNRRSQLAAMSFV